MARSVCAKTPISSVVGKCEERMTFLVLLDLGSTHEGIHEQARTMHRLEHVPTATTEKDLLPVCMILAGNYALASG